MACITVGSVTYARQPVVLAGSDICYGDFKLIYLLRAELCISIADKNLFIYVKTLFYSTDILKQVASSGVAYRKNGAVVQGNDCALG